MSDPISERNIKRYKTAFFTEDDTPFCLAQLCAYDPKNYATAAKRAGLIEGRIINENETERKLACNIGGCTLKVTESVDEGRSVTGQCKAASYCLKQAFDAVGQAPNSDAGRELYREIIDSLEGYKGSNFCPRLNCNLIAGVTDDGIPGTAGTCTQPSEAYDGYQLQINFD